jgi:hypothetical protein
MEVRKQRFLKPLAVLVLALGLVTAVQETSRADVSPTLYVNYTMNCTFTIVDDSGKPVTAIAPGTYQILITSPVAFAAVDLSGIYDMTACKSSAMFQLTGPGVSLQSTLTDGDADHDQLEATFQKSATYVAQDNNQPTVARVTFTTLASGSPVSPPSPTTTTQTSTTTKSGSGGSAIGTSIKGDPFRGTLIGAVSPTGKLSLTDKGRGVAAITSGRYTITVTDKSKTSGFLLQQIRKSASTVTGVGFTGTKSVTLDFKPGQWFFYPTFVGTKSYFIVVAA